MFDPIATGIVRQIQRLTEERDAFRQDAERYRWLEAKCGANGTLIVASVSEFGIDPWSGDDLTGKIDAEMAKHADSETGQL